MYLNYMYVIYQSYNQLPFLKSENIYNAKKLT